MEVTEQDKQLLQLYYSQKKKKTIIILIILFAIILLIVGSGYYFVSSQVNWKLKEDNIQVEYGETCSLNIGALIDTQEYSFITLENTSVDKELPNEEGKEYPAIGEYHFVVTHNGTINIFNVIKKEYTNTRELTVTVADTTPPVITSPEYIEIILGENLNVDAYIELLTVEDVSDTEEINLDMSEVDSNILGDYEAIATVTDTEGNEGQCTVTFKVINDPWEEVEEEIENTDIEETQENETTTKTNTSNSSTSSSSNSSSSTTKKSETTAKTTSTNKTSTATTKDFLFEDGYTMSNVTEAATEYLKSTGKSGECQPIKDENGIYLGMRVIIYQ